MCHPPTVALSLWRKGFPSI
ncbi:unnamed protein product [Gulo gulo]|uniref:Uncharacterized protein n=1 Tax=Gulo gulo TaxID=48420 RepID=A0A9X9LVE9_GULGU|nr:unnamed protein product [Gulo gulo]